jgi:hypothetical protein
MEAPDREVLLKTQQIIRLGSASTGLEFSSVAWPRGEYVLRVEGRNLQKKFPGRATPADAVAIGQMNPARLTESRLDCLLIDGIDVDWIPWLQETDSPRDPRVILWIVDEMCGKRPYGTHELRLAKEDATTRIHFSVLASECTPDGGGVEPIKTSRCIFQRRRAL